MTLPASGIVTVRLAPKDAEGIDALVEDGRFTNRSDFIRHAIRLALAQEHAAAREEQIEETLIRGPGALPAPESDQARRPRARSNKGVKHS